MGDKATATATFDNLAKDFRDAVVAWRRHLHRKPEVSFHEDRLFRLREPRIVRWFGALASAEDERRRPRLVGEQPERTLAIRADMDALPIQEGDDFEFASQNAGAMHACGHDGHIAMLLRTAKILSGMRDRIRGEGA